MENIPQAVITEISDIIPINKVEDMGLDLHILVHEGGYIITQEIEPLLRIIKTLIQVLSPQNLGNLVRKRWQN